MSFRSKLDDIESKKNESLHLETENRLKYLAMKIFDLEKRIEVLENGIKKRTTKN